MAHLFEAFQRKNKAAKVSRVKGD
jgi:hypothetical protein